MGRIRSENQDVWHADPAAGLYFVADGMGGLAAGGAAAQYVAKFLPEALESRLAAVAKEAERHVRTALSGAIADFSAGLRERAKAEAVLKGMGSTLVLALVRGSRVFIAHLGDSRAYLFERGRLKRLTKDHSVAAALLELGKLTPGEAAKHALRHKLTRYIGQDGKADADVHGVEPKAAGRLLLCSDGLTGMLPDERIAAALAEAGTPETACRRLVGEANAAGGADNVTVLVVDLARGG